MCCIFNAQYEQKRRQNDFDPEKELAWNLYLFLTWSALDFMCVVYSPLEIVSQGTVKTSIMIIQWSLHTVKERRVHKLCVVCSSFLYSQ